MSWTWRSTPNWQTNSNIMFAQSPDNGTTWYQQGGHDPVHPADHPIGAPASSVGQVIKAIPQGSSFINQTDMTVDHDNNPIVATYFAPGWNTATNSGDPNRQYMLVYYDGSQWKTTQVSNRTSDTAIDASGNDVRDLGRPIVLVDKQGRVLVVTRSEDTSMGSYANPATPNNGVVVYYSSDFSSGNPTWNSVTLDDANLGAWEPTYDSTLWATQNTLSLLYEPISLSGETTSTVKTLDWDEQAFFSQTPSTQPVSNPSFETPTLSVSPNNQYDPSGASWTFTGNAGIERDGSAFNAAAAPLGVQAAFLQSNVTANQKALGAVSQSINLSPGVYTVSFQAAQRASKPVQPIAFSVDGSQVGATFTPPSTAWTTFTTAPFTISNTGSHTIQFSATDSTLDRTSFLDAVSVNTVDLVPVVTTPAAATPNPVTGTSAALSVLGSDIAGEASLTYTWSATGPAAVTFTDNGSNAAKGVTATFSQAGAYNFVVTVTNASGLSTTSSVPVVVNQSLTAISVSPASISIATGATQQFTATALDQFGQAMTAAIAWATTAGNTITSTGLFTAGATPGGATVTATSGSVSGSAIVTVSAPGKRPPGRAPLSRLSRMVFR